MDYTDEILRDVLTLGVADPEIQLDLLSDSNQNMTLENVFQFIEKKESGKGLPLSSSTLKLRVQQLPRVATVKRRELP